MIDQSLKPDREELVQLACENIDKFQTRLNDG